MRKLMVLIFLISMGGCATAPAVVPEFESGEELYTRFATGKKLVMVTHPSCGFSQKAFQDFSPKIQEYLKTNGVIITQIREEHFDSDLAPVLDWNKKSEHQHIITLEKRIREVHLDSTPQFYFYRDGKRVETITGWPKDKSNLVKIEKAIDRL